MSDDTATRAAQIQERWTGPLLTDRYGDGIMRHPSIGQAQVDIQWLLMTLTDVQAARDLLQRVVDIAGITHFDQTGSPAETISRLRDALAAATTPTDAPTHS